MNAQDKTATSTGSRREFLRRSGAALASNLELAPGLDNLTMDSPAPVMPDGQGRYPVPMPGLTPGF